ncbi:MAG: SUF system NifU family Fe-S cluster assembly protein [Spirochaetes bacterium]|nr:MAG: SUF system NifU family Fe-S cluster assembly protein [Spirochaetota bacterium]
MDLNELYREVILTHAAHPHHYGEIENPDKKSHGANPLCGDSFDIEIKLDGDRISEIAFVGAGCSISKASASMMTEIAKGKTVKEFYALLEKIEKMVRGELEQEEIEKLGDLAALAGVATFPARVKCAILPWKTLKSAVENDD